MRETSRPTSTKATSAYRSLSCPVSRFLEEKMGVIVNFYVTGREMICYQPGQLLGVLGPENKVSMRISVDNDHLPKAVIGLQGEDGVSLVPVHKTTSAYTVYQADMEPVVISTGAYVVLPPGNRLLVLTQDKGKYLLLQAGVFSQSGHTWAWVEGVNQGQLDVRGCHTSSEKWKETVNAMLIASRENRLVEMSKEVRPFPSPSVEPPEGDGEVIYFNLFDGSGYGWFTQCRRRILVKLHYSSVPADPENGVRVLYPGQKITGRVEKPPYRNGPQKGEERFELKKIALL